ncbi:hypothetical protein LCGC14_2518010 [marine sediment metagenome]|uniref:Uncharacterized protein n=1 Tax=marine sediment metagenome TaxID=412755 RepID=A0A0F9AX97_9ZZZZ
MSELQQFIGEDSRKPIQRLRRCQLHKIADGFKLQYPPGATKDVMIKLFEANDIDVTQSPDVQWQAFNGLGEDGQPRQEFYPVEQQPGSMRSGVNAAAVLNERLSEKEEEERGFDKARIDALERELDQSRRTNEQLKGILEERLAALENKKPVDKDSSPATPYWAKYRKAKDMGLDVDRCMKLPEIEALIEKAEQANA